METGPEKELKDLERALSRLVPQAPDVQRDRLLYSAGQASLRRLSRLFLLGNFLLAVMCGYLSYLLWVRPKPEPEVKYVIREIERPRETPPSAEPPIPDLPESGPLPAKPRPAEDPGSHYPPPYGTIQQRLPHLGEGALPPLVAAPPGAPGDDPSAVGDRPGLFGPSFLFSLPRR